MSPYDYDEKAAYERRRSQCRQSCRESYDSKASTTSFSSHSEKSTENSPPPPYAYIFYNKINDKPLPPLPRGRERRVRFLIDKPLPSLPQDKIKRSSSCDGEYAWWAVEMSSDEDEKRDVEKEMS
jgi:hypothetical protein